MRRCKVQKRVIELIGTIQPRIFSSLNPAKIIEVFRFGEGVPPTTGMRTADVHDGFFSFMGFTRLSGMSVLSKPLDRGVEEGVFGYVSGPAPALGPDGRYQLAPGRARLGCSMPETRSTLNRAI
jgi:hypothetical protein